LGGKPGKTRSDEKVGEKAQRGGVRGGVGQKRSWRRDGENIVNLQETRAILGKQKLKGIKV